MDPDADAREIYQRLGKLLTPKQVDMLEQMLYYVRREGGAGKVYLDLRAGTVKYIGVDIRREV